MDAQVWSVTGIAILVVATTIAVIGYVRHRSRENASLTRDAQLAALLREAAGDDEVRLAAVGEFETTIYKRLFFASTVGPRLRALAWAVLGVVIAATITVGLRNGTPPNRGLIADVISFGFLALTVVFAIAVVAFALSALYAALVLPRIAFDDDNETDEDRSESDGADEDAAVPSSEDAADSSGATKVEAPSSETIKS